jgi:Mechanosensitive ion channel, conserved TM helix
MNLVDTLSESFNKAVADIVNAIPTVVGAILILLVGLIVGRIVGGIVTGLLVRAKADSLFSRYAGTIYGDAPGSTKPTEYIGTLAKWLVYLVFFLSAANFLGWTQVSILINDFLAWLPNLIVAVIIVLAAPVIGRVIRTAIEASGDGLGLSNTELLGRLAEAAVIAFGVIIALYQVGIASDLVNILFIGLVFGLALAFGLAFGLGGRAVAEDMSRAWYQRSIEMANRISESQGTSTPPAPPRQSPPPPQPPMQGG